MSFTIQSSKLTLGICFQVVLNWKDPWKVCEWSSVCCLRRLAAVTGIDGGLTLAAVLDSVAAQQLGADGGGGGGARQRLSDKLYGRWHYLPGSAAAAAPVAAAFYHHHPVTQHLQQQQQAQKAPGDMVHHTALGGSPPGAGAPSPAAGFLPLPLRLGEAPGAGADPAAAAAVAAMMQGMRLPLALTKKHGKQGGVGLDLASGRAAAAHSEGEHFRFRSDAGFAR